MKSIKIGGKTFTLASRLTRLYALAIDIAVLGAIQSVIAFLFSIAMLVFFESAPLRFNVFPSANRILSGIGIGVFASVLSMALWTFGLFFMDGLRKGQGIGKKLLSLQVVRLQDGKPCTFKDAFLRRFAGVFQPFDLLWFLGKKRQRLGDKFAETVVVKYEPAPEPPKVDSKDPEYVLERAIGEMKSLLAAAQQKVDASVAVEQQFQENYERAAAEADRWKDRARIALEAGREDIAREDLEKRREYQRSAAQYRRQWEDQQQVVRELHELLGHLQQQLMEAERQRAVVLAKQRNVDAETHLQEIQTDKVFDALAAMEQRATEAEALAKTAAATDVDYRDAQLEREFASYAEEASVDKDLAELKASLR